MANFTQLKAAGKRVRVDLDKVIFFTEVESGTELTFEQGHTLTVSDSYQTVSNRAAGKGE